MISNHLSNSKQKGKYTEREEKEAERGSGKKTKWNNTYTQTHHLVDSLNQIEIHGNRSINKTLSSFINKQKREPAPIFWSWSETNFLVKKREKRTQAKCRWKRKKGLLFQYENYMEFWERTRVRARRKSIWLVDVWTFLQRSFAMLNKTTCSRADSATTTTIKRTKNRNICEPNQTTKRTKWSRI